MKLILKKVRFANFMSFGNMWTEIDLNTHPTTLIVGKNGSGKSSAILDTISFALFNKPFRNIRKPQLTNSINNKNCLVELYFSVNNNNFKVVRGIKPAVFEIYKNEELITQSADNRDYQDAFEKYILRVNHKTFCQIVMLGSAIFTPFMGLPAQARRDVIEDLLDLKIFSTMNVLLKTRLSSNEATLSSIQTEKRILTEKIEITRKHIAEALEAKRVSIHEKEEQISSLEMERQTHSIDIAGIQKLISDLITNLGDIKHVKKTSDEINKLYHQLIHKSESIKKEIDFLTNEKNCPTCEQVIDNDFRERKVVEKTKTYEELNNGIAQLLKKQENLNNKLTHIAEIQAKIQEWNDVIKEHRSKMDVIDMQIKHIETDIENISKSKREIDLSGLEGMINQLGDVKTHLVQLEDDQNIMGFAANMLKDTGIKARIIKMYISVINTLIAKYLAALDFFVSFELDENFNETIKSRFRDEFSYMSFSEGEKCRLNIAILFAWRAIAKMRGSIDCNLIVLDELFDSSLDLTGIDDMMKLLNNLTNNENVFIISHREDQISEKFARVIRFQKTKNFSEIG